MELLWSIDGGIRVVSGVDSVITLTLTTPDLRLALYTKCHKEHLRSIATLFEFRNLGVRILDGAETRSNGMTGLCGLPHSGVNRSRNIIPDHRCCDDKADEG